MLDLRGICVIFKPPGWETDVYDVEKFGVPITPTARNHLLSTFLASRFVKDAFPICHLAQYGFGLIHRLDQMSSGLLVGTTSFSAHSLLQFQMCSYQIHREYCVLCHGSVPRSLAIRQRILEGAVRGRCTFGERCRVHVRGKPAQTHVLPCAHGKLEDSFSLVAISIFTGRQHQIRVHLQNMGHPTVYDGRYFAQDVLLRSSLADLRRAPTECPRPRSLPDRHRFELSLRGCSLW